MDGHQIGSSQTVIFLNDKIISTEKKRWISLPCVPSSPATPPVNGPAEPCQLIAQLLLCGNGCLILFVKRVVNWKGILPRILFKDFVLLHLLTEKKDCPYTEHPHCCANTEKNFSFALSRCTEQTLCDEVNISPIPNHFR